MRGDPERVSHGRWPSPSSLPRPIPFVIGDPATPPPGRVAGAAPIIVTATMGAADQRFFDALRQAHFPPARNVLSAHLTLFHQLPPSCLAELDRLLKAIVADGPPPATVSDIFSLGGGVAYRVDSPELLAIREYIADWFAGSLSAQDRGIPRLHITVQNKVESAQARALLAELRRDFHPRPLSIVGLAAHHYRGGPWETAVTRNFRGRR